MVVVRTVRRKATLHNIDSDERGAALIMGVICLSVVFAMSAIVVDINIARGLQRSTSQSADAAALAAAGNLSDGMSWASTVTSVKRYSQYNLGTNPSTWAGCSDNQAPAALHTSPYYPDSANSDTCISTDSQLNPTVVRILVPLKSSPTFFASLFGLSSVGRRAAAMATVASVGPPSVCAVCVLRSTAGTMRVGYDHAHLKVTDPTGTAGIMVNSDSNPALTAETDSSVAAPSISVVGGYMGWGGGTFSPTPTIGVAPIADPLAYLPVPSVYTTPPLPSCDPGGTYSSGYYGPAETVAIRAGSCHISPGVYSQIIVYPNATVHFNPGLYVVYGAVYENGNNAVIDSTDATIYLTCSSYPVPCAPGSTGGVFGTVGKAIYMSLDPPNTGPYQGLSIFSDRNNVSDVFLSAHDVNTMSGSIYAATGTVHLLAVGGGSSTAVMRSMLVAGTLDLLGADFTLEVIYDRAANVPIPPTVKPVGLYQ